MTQLLEQRLKSFLDFIQTSQNKFVCSIFMQEIEKTLQSLHGIEKNTEINLAKYRTRFEWMREENIDTWKEIARE